MRPLRTELPVVDSGHIMYLPLRTRGGGRGRREGICIRFAGRVARALCAAAYSSARVLESITPSTLPVTSERAHRRAVRCDLRREFRWGFQSMRTSLPRRGRLVLLAALTCDATRRARRTHRVPYATCHLQQLIFFCSRLQRAEQQERSAVHRTGRTCLTERICT